MMCPKCESYRTKVIDSRAIEENIFRKRKCSDCGYVYYTEEIHIDDNSVVNEYMAAVKRIQRNK